ncbi:GIDE domain-containing protein [Sulfurivermis fontis]|uniref:GIDE domain-containing protein n=1 Tax=Sulfurivermis fontis TaxID=1972068 RepID=UPI000FD6E10C|nr:GIDE domain-containing protein [Sulfurivermis fontis]
MFESLIPPDWALRVQQLAPAEFWIGTGLLIALALGGFYAIFRFLKRYHIIEGTPTSRVRSAAQGYVELDGIGYLMPGTPIIAPLSGITCTWYHYKVEEKTASGGDNRERWRTLRQETSDELFLLKDDTGECVIDPEGAEVTPAISEVWYGDTPMWNGGARRGRIGRYRYTEKRMHPGDMLYAIGQFRSVGGSQELPNTHEEVRQLLAEWKRDQVSLHARFDRNNDGVLSVDEWEAVRKAAWKEVLAEQAKRARGPVHHLLTRPDDSRRPFILSVLPQELLIRRYRVYAGLSLLVFLLAGSAATWLLTARFGALP